MPKLLSERRRLDVSICPKNSIRFWKHSTNSALVNGGNTLANGAWVGRPNVSASLTRQYPSLAFANLFVADFGDACWSVSYGRLRFQSRLQPASLSALDLPTQREQRSHGAGAVGRAIDSNGDSFCEEFELGRVRPCSV